MWVHAFFSLCLPRAWATLGWKAKIREDERNEEPHVSILFKLWTWRLSLRTGEFLDTAPPPRDVPAELVEWVWDWADAKTRRNRETQRARSASLSSSASRREAPKYPENVVFSKQEDR